MQDLSHNPQYYIRHYEYLESGKINIDKNFEKLSSGSNFYMSRQCSFTKIGNTIYNIPTFWQMLTGKTGTNSKTANYTTWNVPIYALDTTNNDNDFQIICNSIGVPIVSVINSNSTSKIYFFAGTDATYLQYYDLETQTIGSVFTDENGNKTASNLSWHHFSYLDETEQVLYEMGTHFTRLDLATNTELDRTSLGLSVHSNVEVINDEFYFVSLLSDRSKTKLYKITKSGVLSTVATMQEADDIGSNMGYSIAYYNNKIHMYYAVNGVLKRKRYVYSIDTSEVETYDNMFQDNGMYIYDSGLGSNSTCHLPAIATSTGIHYFTGTTYNFDNKFTNSFNHYLYTEISADTPIDPDNPDEPTIPEVVNPDEDGKIFYITNTGDGYFYGNVYAKDGIFKGDIIAKSLTLSEDATVEGAIKSTTGEIGGWTINDNSLSTDNITLLSDDYGQIRCKTDDFYALLYDGKYIFGVWDEDNPYQTIDKKYVDISAKGIYARGSETSGYLLEVNNDNDTVTVYSTTDDKALSVVNFGTGNTLYLQNSESSYSNAAMRAYVVHDYTYEDDEGVEQTEKRSAYVSLFGEKENGRIVFRTDMDKGNAYNNSSIGTANFRWGSGYFGKLYTDSGSITDSDAKVKTIVNELDNELALTFINNLKPTEYYYNNSNNQRVHMGFIAQEVNKVAKDLDMGNMSIYEAVKIDSDGREHYYSDEYSDEELKWTLNYNEFIAPLVGAVQALTKKVEVLEAEIKELKNK